MSEPLTDAAVRKLAMTALNRLAQSLPAVGCWCSLFTRPALYSLPSSPGLKPGGSWSGGVAICR
jgi:hypothetical protein